MNQSQGSFSIFEFFSVVEKGQFVDEVRLCIIVWGILNARNNFIFHHLMSIIDVLCAWEKFACRCFEIILVEDYQIFTIALPANSQLMLVDGVFVHFDDALREGKVTIRVSN